MGKWQSVNEVCPWLSNGPPYFVHTTEEARLRADLEREEFSIAMMSGRGLKDENALLERLGVVLGFPGYYGATWDAFIDSAGDLVVAQRSIALLWTEADMLLSVDPRVFVRSACYLLSVSRDLGSVPEPYQFEVFFVGSDAAFRNRAGV